MEQAVELVHQAKKAQGEQKGTIFEKLLTLIRGIKAAPSLLEEILPLVLEMRQDAEARPFVAQFIEEVCKRRPNLIPAAAATLRAFSYNEKEPETLVKSIKAVGVLFKKTLALVCSEDSEVDDDEGAESWEQIHQAATSLRSHTTHQALSVRHASIMLLQILALALTPTEDGEEVDGARGGSGWTLALIPPCHPVLDYTDLKKEGEGCLSSLLELLDPERDTPLETLTVTINALGRLARNRPQLLGQIEPALERLRTDPPKALSKDWQSASLKFTLKSTLLALLKLPGCAAYAAVLTERLKALGAHTQAEAARRVMQKEQAKERKAVQDPRLVGEQEGKPPKRHRPHSSAPLVPPERIPKDTPLEEWDPELVSDLVMAAMVNYPPALPPHLLDVAETPLSMWPERLAFPSLHSKAPAEAAKEDEEGEGAEGPEDASSSAESIRKKALLSAKPLKRDLVKTLASDALIRLLHVSIRIHAVWQSNGMALHHASGSMVTFHVVLVSLHVCLVMTGSCAQGDGAGWTAKGVVVARLWAGSEAVGGETEDEIISYAIRSYHDRHGLVIQYLYELYALEKGRAVFQPAKPRYKQTLMSLLRAVAEVDDGKHLTSVLAEAPVVDADAATFVSGLCERENMRQVGLSCLRALIVHHPSWRADCLQRLLQHTAAEDDAVRSPAVRLVANKLFGKPYLVGAIQTFAVSNLRKACQVDVPEDAEKKPDAMETEGDKQQRPDGVVRHLMHLFLALCAQKQVLLHDLVETYVQSPQHARSAIHASITDMVRAIGPESPQLLEILRDFPAGAELLILAFVRTLTDSGGPHHKLNMAIKDMYARTSDARFMIYICASLPRAEVESLLPRLVALPPVGVKAALHRLLHSRPPPVKPQELIVALHKLSPTKELTMKKVAEAIDVCFNDKSIFSTQVLAVVLQQLLDQNPLPTLYMRTVLLSLKLSPNLTDFVMDVILQRLISKQVWLLPTLWEGFIKCCRQTLPRSLRVLVQLPRNRLEDAISRCPELAPPLENYYRQQQAQGFKVSAQALAAISSANNAPQ